ncbi:MAG TPA: cysteine desulfurase family protein [Ktedonobacteraceae bacterium]|nr:cysteine desulfurase family protein [Ktedonobacteraceae bacterium]
MSSHPGLEGGPIYLDYNATTPVDPEVAEVMWPYLLQHFGNPSSTHSYGQQAHRGIVQARQQVADLLECSSEEILFTGGGSESDNLAIRGIALANNQRGKHVITQVTEHPAVLNVCHALHRLHGFEITLLPVDRYGLIDLAELDRSLRDDTVLVTIMHANNETGTLQPLKEIAQIVHQRGSLLHSDGAQSVGKISVHPRELGVDLFTIAGHKLYAPKGIGALYVRRDLLNRLEPVIYGGGQEHGRRAGTESVAAIVGLGKACQLAAEQLLASQTRLRALRDNFQQMLEQALPGRVHLNGHPAERLPNTLNIRVDGISGEQTLANLSGLASSTGSACHEGLTEPSGVLTAMGLTSPQALSALRLTLGRWTDEAQIAEAARLLLQEISSPHH